MDDSSHRRNMRRPGDQFIRLRRALIQLSQRRLIGAALRGLATDARRGILARLVRVRINDLTEALECRFGLYLA